MPTRITPSIDPLTAVLQIGVLGESVDRAQGALPGQEPLDVAWVLVCDHELVFQIQLFGCLGRRFFELNYLRCNAFGWCGAAPHAQRCGYFFVIRQHSEFLRNGGVHDFQSRMFHVPGQRHRPMSELAYAVGGGVDDFDAAQSDLLHSVAQVLRRFLELRKSEPAIRSVDPPHVLHCLLRFDFGTDLVNQLVQSGSGT